MYVKFINTIDIIIKILKNEISFQNIIEAKIIEIKQVSF